MSRRLVVTAFVLCLAALAAASASFAAPPPLTTSPITSPDGLWTWSRPLPFGYGLGEMAAPAPGTLFVATSEPDLLVTHDGGVSWAWARTSAVPGFGGLDGVAFTSALDGWAWGSDVTGQSVMVLRTTDGGDTWRSSVSVPAARYGGG
ncbi:MAG TPA: hypothetical protein VK576_08245, partial [Thermoleophilia bacterium]|nr:hypothetical protein [Thermoleophilia bacterium]